MPELRDAPAVIRRIGALPFAAKVWKEIGDDNLFTWASALAYSWLFAIFPFFLVLLTLIPFLRYEWRVEAKEQINVAIDQLPRETKTTIHEYIDPRLNDLLFSPPAHISFIWITGLAVTLWAASGGMAMTMAAMDRAYDVERVRPFYKQRPLAVLLTLIVAALILVVVVLIPIGTLVTRYLTKSTETLITATSVGRAATQSVAGHRDSSTTSTTAPATKGSGILVAEGHHHWFRPWIILWQIVRHLLAMVLLFWVVGLVYHFGPNVKQKFRVITPGAVFTVAVWVLLAIVFRTYIDKFGKYDKTYGAVGGVIILLFFFYLDALVLLVGAEINAEIDADLRKFAHEQATPPPVGDTVDAEAAKETP